MQRQPKPAQHATIRDNSWMELGFGASCHVFPNYQAPRGVDFSAQIIVNFLSYCGREGFERKNVILLVGMAEAVFKAFDKFRRSERVAFDIKYYY